MKATNLIFVFLFVCIFLLIQSNSWMQYDCHPSILGLPAWLGYFIIIHLIFVFILYCFVHKSSK